MYIYLGTLIEYWWILNFFIIFQMFLNLLFIINMKYW